MFGGREGVNWEQLPTQQGDVCYRVFHNDIPYHAMYLHRFKAANARKNGKVIRDTEGKPIQVATVEEAMRLAEDDMAGIVRPPEELTYGKPKPPKRRPRRVHTG